MGIGTLLQFSNILRADPVLLKLVFSPSSFILLSFVWFYISFSDGQVLLSASVSESVFLMFPWREMYTMSNYSFTILYSKQVCFFFFFLISWLQSSSTGILKLKKGKSVTASTFPFTIYHEVVGTEAMISVFLMMSLKPAFTLSSFTIIQRFIIQRFHFPPLEW